MISRRHMLALAGATAVGGIAGQAGGTPSARAARSDELSEYTRWLTLGTDETVGFAYVDWSTITALVTDEADAADDSDLAPDMDDIGDEPIDFEEDPMAVYPATGLTGTVLYADLVLPQYGLTGLVGDDPSTPLESNGDELLLTTEVFVVEGTLDIAELDERLTRDSEESVERQLERVVEHGSYDLYSDGETAVAVSEDAAVFYAGLGANVDALSSLETAIDAAVGDHDRATTDSESFAWLADTAGHGDFVFGSYGGPDTSPAAVDTDADFEALATADGVVSSLAVDESEHFTGAFAALIEEPDEPTLETLLGTSADEQSVTIDENRVTATGRWQDVS
ncbi:hypothetical protein OB905_03110 [Halobacteria archaeon AArc-dxtr1]|nr:hypothetical protein [Halobacteria archaeon AArc-dxtr1]